MAGIQEIVRNAIPAPIRKAHWNFIFPESVSKIGARVTRASHPLFNIDTELVQLTPDEIIELPTHLNYGDISLSVIENKDVSTLKYFQDWKTLMFNSNGTINPWRNYSKTCYLEVLSGADELLQRIELIGAYPKKISDIEWDYSSNDLLIYEVTLSCKRIQ